MASAAGRLVITIMAAVSQWEPEAVAERTRDALRHKRSTGSGWAISGSDAVPTRMASTSSQIRARSLRSVICARAAARCEGLRPP
jgi:site-specific DNA recombinase